MGLRVLLFVVGICGTLQGITQDSLAQWSTELETYWSAIDSAYRDTLHSPLPAADRKEFLALERFPADPAYLIKAKFVPQEGAVFGMKTSTTREPKYKSVGVLHFVLNGQGEQLTVYKNIDLSKLEDYWNYLFVPFTDLTNGEETYGGGRYVDLTGPLGAEVELDLNRAYNPYCAYGGSYSCPIPPEENHLDIAVKAGVLKYHE